MKLPRKSLVSHLVFYFLSVSLMTVLIVGLISYQRARSALVSAVYDRLKATLELKEDALNRWVDEKLDDITFIKTQPDIRKSMETLLCECDPANFTQAYNTLFGTFQTMFVNMGDFSEVSLLSARGGRVIVSSRLENEGDYRVSDNYFVQGLKKPHIQKIYLSPVTFKPTITVASPIYDDTGQSVGVLAANLDMERMDRIVLERTGLGESGESYLVDSTNSFVTGKEFGRSEFPRGAHSSGIQKALKGLSGTGLYRNYAGIPVVGAFKWVPERKLAIIAEIEQSEAFAPARGLAYQIIVAGCFISLLLAVVVNIVARRIALPILDVRNAAEQIAGGERDIRAPVKGVNEVGVLARSFNLMVDEIQESEERLNTVFRLSPGVIAISRVHDNVIVDVNEEFTRITGYSKEESIGQNVLELGLWDDFKEREQFFRTVLEEGSAANFELNFKAKYNQIRIGLLSATVTRLGGEPHIIFGGQDITELKEAEKELQDSEERLQTVFSTSPGVIFVTRLRDDRIVDINDGFIMSTGFTREEAIGWSVADLGLWTDPGEKEEFDRQIIEDGQVENAEFSYRTKSGQTRVSILSAAIVKLSGEPHILASAQDITAMKDAEKVILESEDKFRTIFMTIPDSVSLSSLEDGVFIDVNEGFERLTGYSRKEALNMSATDLWIDQDKRSQIIEELAREGEIHNLEGQFRIKDGSIRSGLISASVITISDRNYILGVHKDITDRKKIQDALRESEEKYRLLAENVSDVIWVWDENFKPVYYSPSVEQLRGVTPEEAIKQPLEDIMTPESYQVAQEAFARELGNEEKGGAKRADIFSMDLELVKKGGSTVWTAVNMKVMRDEEGKIQGVVGVSRDITRRMSAEKALRESEERYRILFNSGSDAVFISGIEESGLPGKFYAVNDRACQLLGRTRQEIMEMRPFDITVPGTPYTDAEGVSRIQHQEQTVFNRLLLHASGKQIPVEITGNRFQMFGSPALYFIVRDLSDQKRIEEEKNRIQTKLIQANKMTSMGLMVSSLAHEINNPNNTIMFNLRRFAKTWDDVLPILNEYSDEHGDFNVGGVPYSDLSAVFPQLIAGTLESSEMIKAIIENLKGFVRQSTDTMDFSVDVNDVVRSAVSLLESQVRRGVGRLEVDLAENIPRIRGNPQKLIQVMVNLVSNALEAQAEGEEGIEVSTSFDAAESIVKLTVKDKGEGMTQEQVSNASEPFFSTKLESGGTGLGLTITTMLLDEHGADMQIDSTPGEGTIVTVSLNVETGGAVH